MEQKCKRAKLLLEASGDSAWSITRRGRLNNGKVSAYLNGYGKLTAEEEARLFRTLRAAIRGRVRKCAAVISELEGNSKAPRSAAEISP